jgi:hypothetical protein
MIEACLVRALIQIKDAANQIAGSAALRVSARARLVASIRLCQAGAVFLACLTACAPLPRLHAVPADEQDRVTVFGMTEIRYWGDSEPSSLTQDGLAALARERANWAATGHAGPLPPANYLAISGGGENGAP